METTAVVLLMPESYGCTQGLAIYRMKDFARTNWPIAGPEPPKRIRLSVKKLDAAWFDAAIHDTIGGPHISQAIHDPVKMVGFTAQLAKFSLRCGGRSLEAVVKPITGTPPYEFFFYRDLAPLLWPHTGRLLGSAPDPSGSGALLMILEALPTATLPETMTPDNARQAIRTLARMHARFWDDPTLNRFNWLPDFCDCDLNQFHDRFRSGLDALVGLQSLPYFPKILKSGAREHLLAAAGRIDSMLATLAALPQTLVHGDANLANFLVYQHNARTDAIIDWQNMCRGPSIIDLIYVDSIQAFRRANRFGVRS